MQNNPLETHFVHRVTQQQQEIPYVEGGLSDYHIEDVHQSPFYTYTCDYGIHIITYNRPHGYT